MEFGIFSQMHCPPWDDEHRAWQAFCASDPARYAGLTLPRVLARLPYGKDGRPCEAFAFEELTDSAASPLSSWSLI